MRWNSLTFPSMRKGRSGMSGVWTGSGIPRGCCGGSFFRLLFDFVSGMPGDEFITWAENTLVEANRPAPARKFCKKPRLLLMLSSLRIGKHNFLKWIGCYVC